jgi:hypothetical protein
MTMVAKLLLLQRLFNVVVVAVQQHHRHAIAFVVAG